LDFEEICKKELPRRYATWTYDPPSRTFFWQPDFYGDAFAPPLWSIPFLSAEKAERRFS
jgi:hypothetical protein